MIASGSPPVHPGRDGPVEDVVRVAPRATPHLGVAARSSSGSGGRATPTRCRARPSAPPRRGRPPGRPSAGSTRAYRSSLRYVAGDPVFLQTPPSGEAQVGLALVADDQDLLIAAVATAPSDRRAPAPRPPRRRASEMPPRSRATRSRAPRPRRGPRRGGTPRGATSARRAGRRADHPSSACDLARTATTASTTPATAKQSARFALVVVVPFLLGRCGLGRLLGRGRGQHHARRRLIRVRRADPAHDLAALVLLTGGELEHRAALSGTGADAELVELARRDRAAGPGHRRDAVGDGLPFVGDRLGELLPRDRPRQPGLGWKLTVSRASGNPRTTEWCRRRPARWARGREAGEAVGRASRAG